jgi:hypothetical protein
MCINVDPSSSLLLESHQMIAKWQIDARFGQKQKVIDKLKEWEQTIGPKVCA